MGALISKEHLAKVKGYVALAREEGCSVLSGEGVEQLELPTKNQGVSEVIVCVGGLPRIVSYVAPFWGACVCVWTLHKPCRWLCFVFCVSVNEELAFREFGLDR